jgi:hypothetical protein
MPAAYGIVALLLILLGLLAPWVSPDDPLRPNVLARAQEPSRQHWLGTDFIGRDVLSRIVHGAKWSLFVAVTSVLLGSTVGAVWALASAFFSGTFDLLGQRLVEVLLSFPPILLALLLASALGASTWTVILSIAVTRVPNPVIRSQALREGASAARGGSSSWRHLPAHRISTSGRTWLLSRVARHAIVLEATLLSAFPAHARGQQLGDASANPKWHRMVPGVPSSSRSWRSISSGTVCATPWTPGFAAATSRTRRAGLSGLGMDNDRSRRAESRRVAGVAGMASSPVTRGAVAHRWP